MVGWIWIPISLFAGAVFGMIVLALTQGDDDR